LEGEESNGEKQKEMKQRGPETRNVGKEKR